MIVRATLDDRPGMVWLMREAHEAAGIFPFPFSAPHAYELASRHIAERDCLALVDKVGDQVQGILLASAQEHPFARVRYAAETLWYIQPEARGGVAAARMLQGYEAWAKLAGCAFAGMAALATFPGAGRIYERKGYTPTETHYLKVL